jgi:hypothetical protein
MTVQNQHFVVLEKKDTYLQSDDYDGVLGLGFFGMLRTKRNITDYPYVPMLKIYRPKPVFGNIFQQNLVSLNVFSFYYNR